MEIHKIFATDRNINYICWDQHPYFNVGDVVKFSLTNDDVVQAMAVEQDGDNMIFCMMDCLPGKYEMYCQAINCGDYENSDLRKKLNNELIDLFPVDLVAKLIPFENGDFLRIPTEKEIFGENKYGERESMLVEQWKPMKKRRNRMAFDGSKDENLQWYWLMNKVGESTTSFSSGGHGGRADVNSASVSLGVRPVFQIVNKEQS